MRKRLSRLIAVISAAFIAAAGIGISALPAQADGVNGEVRGFLWPGGVGNNWEGTYRMPGGIEAWCASIWQPEPIYATGWHAPTTLTYNTGAPIEQVKMERLAYIISYASDLVIGEHGYTADTYAAAVSVIVRDWTNHPTSGQSYAPDGAPHWPLPLFDGKTDPQNTGQDPRGVRAAYNKLLADSNNYRGEWAITLGSDLSEVKIGETATITGTLKRASDGLAIPNHDVDLAITGGTLSSARVTTNAQGQFSSVATITAPAATVTASRISPATTVQMRQPSGWTSNRKPQNMILVSDNKVSASVDIMGTSIELGTSATDQTDGDKTLHWTGGTIVDVVSYKGLEPGQEYTVEGELMNKATGEGTGIFGETTFTAEERDGTIAVEFVVPAGHAGSTLVVFEKLYNTDGKLIADHEDIEDEEQTVVVEDAPTLGTSAYDQSDEDKILHWNGGTITDQVTYTGLIIGDEYTVTGELMDKETGEGTGIFGETTFTAEERDGTIAVEFVVPAGHAGSTLVVFEKLYNTDGKLIADHEDIEDEEQTVKVNEQPTLKTKASDQADGDKVIAWNGGTVVDHVTYTGLTIGQKYTVTGELMDKATGKGTGIKGQTTFTAESIDGTVKVTFKVPKGYADKTLVAFERLYDAGGVLQAVHEDINDKEQTVTVAKQPVGPDLAKTGADDALFYALGAATLLGLGGALQLARNRRLKA